MNTQHDEAASYTSQVEKVLLKEALAKKISIWANKIPCLNLVDINWKAKLENDPVYQKFSTRSKECYYSPQPNCKFGPSYNMYRQFINTPPLNVLMLMKARIDEKSDSLSIYTMENEPCAPLNMIVKAMTSDIPLGVEIYNSIKLFMDDCDPKKCYVCTIGRKKYAEQSRTVKRKEPCIQWTNLYDGINVVQLYGSDLKTCFSKTSFSAIVIMKLEGRTIFNRKSDRKRVLSLSGKLQRILLFDERWLTQEEDEEPITIGDIASYSEDNNAFNNNRSENNSAVYDPEPVETNIQQPSTEIQMNSASIEDARPWYERDDIAQLFYNASSDMKRDLDDDNESALPNKRAKQDADNDIVEEVISTLPTTLAEEQDIEHGIVEDIISTLPTTSAKEQYADNEIDDIISALPSELAEEYTSNDNVIVEEKNFDLI